MPADGARLNADLVATAPVCGNLAAPRRAALYKNQFPDHDSLSFQKVYQRFALVLDRHTHMYDRVRHVRKGARNLVEMVCKDFLCLPNLLSVEHVPSVGTKLFRLRYVAVKPCKLLIRL